MVKEAPFDAWDGEDLESAEVVPDDAAEAVAMHLEPDGGEQDAGRWSDLTGDRDLGSDDRPVCYFDDEQPERAEPVMDLDEQPEPDLEELLERQHYAFPQRS